MTNNIFVVPGFRPPGRYFLLEKYRDKNKTVSGISIVFMNARKVSIRRDDILTRTFLNINYEPSDSEKMKYLVKSLLAVSEVIEW